MSRRLKAKASTTERPPSSGIEPQAVPTLPTHQVDVLWYASLFMLPQEWSHFLFSLVSARLLPFSRLCGLGVGEKRAGTWGVTSCQVGLNVAKSFVAGRGRSVWPLAGPSANMRRFGEHQLRFGEESRLGEGKIR